MCLHCCCGRVCLSVAGLGREAGRAGGSLAGWLNDGVLGTVLLGLPAWQAAEWEQKNISGRALLLQIGPETVLRPAAGGVN